MTVYARLTVFLGVTELMERDMAKRSHYQVIVGNVGTVYDGTSNSDAIMTWIAYCDMSREGRGRAAGETVTILKDGEIANEYTGTLAQEE